MSDERAAVLEIVESYFDGRAEDDVIWGPLRDWSDLRGEPSWNERFEHTHMFESAAILELSESTAVVDVRAEYHARLRKGSWQTRVRFDGPVRLRKVDGKWRIVDYTMENRSRAQDIVLGTLAEQSRDDITIAVVGAARSTRAVEVAVEIANAGAEAVKVNHVYALLESQNAWRRGSLSSKPLIHPGDAERVLVSVPHPVEGPEPHIFIALRLLGDKRNIDFLTGVPLTPGAEPVRQAPRRLPLFRSTWPRSIVFWAALTAAAAWFYGWLAIIVPVYYYLGVYRNVRILGRLPSRLQPIRFAVDAVVLLAVFVALWETPAVVLAVPVLVMGVVYVLLKPFRFVTEQAKVVVALCAATAWLFLLGTFSGPLSPCRIADGAPATTADRFARALLTGERAQAFSLETSAARQIGVIPSVPSSVAAVLAERRRSSSCFGLSSIDHCYEYRAPKQTRRLFVVVGCETRAWRVRTWAPF